MGYLCLTTATKPLRKKIYMIYRCNPFIKNVFTLNQILTKYIVHVYTVSLYVCVHVQAFRYLCN